MKPDQRRLQALVDFHDVGQVLYGYASSIDVKDFASLRTLLTDDAVAKFGDYEPVAGADAVVAWIEQATDDRSWQHHLISVYQVDVDGDEATALTYHTSHQTFVAEPDVVAVIVARYHDRLRREDDRWRIAEKTMEIGWRERRRRS